MNEKLVEALEHISDDHLTEALRRKRRKHHLPKIAAAVLALVFLLDLPPLTPPIRAQALAEAAEYTPAPRPDSEDYPVWEDYQAAREAWNQQTELKELTARTLNRDLLPFYEEANRIFLDSDENRVWSPINAGLALSMLAQTASGETRSQLLALLGADSADSLRTRFQSLWESIWLDADWGKRSLAASVWVDEAVDVRSDVLDTLSQSYYASVYRADLSSDAAGNAMADWISRNTGGILGDELSPAVDERSVMALLTTVWLEGFWLEEFNDALNTTDVFHAPGGDTECTFMHKKRSTMTYARGEGYGAVALPIKWDSTLWLILPDEGKTVSDILADRGYLDTVTAVGKFDGDRGEYLVDLALPKFDIRTELDLQEGLKELGLTEVFHEDCTGLSEAFLTDDPVFLSSARQVTRVTIDEEGVTAGSYTELIAAAGEPLPPEEIIDFTLDRPFLFALTENNTGTLLFTGVVNDP